MSTSTEREISTGQDQGNEPVTDISSQLALDPIDSTTKHHSMISAPEAQLSKGPAARAPAVVAQQQALPSFDIAHQGWDASNVSTAKCDLCQQQRRGTLQKCRVCKLSICQECCLGDRLQNDRRHKIDAAAVNWDAPPNSRKRKHRALESRSERPIEPKRRRVIANPRRGRGRSTTQESGGTLAPSVVHNNNRSDKVIPVTDCETLEQQSSIGYSHIGPLEPRLSVAPASHYPSMSCAQPRDAVPAKYPDQYAQQTVSPRNRRLWLIEETQDIDGRSRSRVSPDSELYPAVYNSRQLYQHPISPINGSPQAAVHQPILPPNTLFELDKNGLHHPSAERFQNSSDIFNRLEHLLHHHRQPIMSETWPPHERVSSLGIRLADAARVKHMSSSTPIPLDQCLRDEMHHEWNSHKFIGTDPDAGRRYRHLLAAAYFASTCLGLSPQLNAAREWLREKEQSLRETGYEPTKSAPLLNFLQEIGVWYLQQTQR
ncbi:hypothetical protein TARUN_8520 [Trichoderma arundinaceum]|uniref:Uncharacterized protein n=1 Tax=Trichoderma arundinaceum TaxID=490622 RepID=A0A395NC92_TRIAR|nr:hypothetical protein TARUN_8520 [Trichoderma arundinaceum]